MKRRVNWTFYAIPISLFAWVAAVCLVRGPRQLPMRALMAIGVFLFELIVIGSVCVIHEILDKIWEAPANYRKAEIRRRRRRGWCVACGYSLRGNVSGVCPECGMSPEAALAAGEMRVRLPNPAARWALSIIVSGVVGFVLAMVAR